MHSADLMYPTRLPNHLTDCRGNPGSLHEVLAKVRPGNYMELMNIAAQLQVNAKILIQYHSILFGPHATKEKTEPPPQPLCKSIFLKISAIYSELLLVDIPTEGDYREA